ncbi:MAG: hypothetical protein MRZ79_07395 [Bacteroidia bacterium]|nr:hypothetical protein [Bacteroidia bacterium]
MSIKALIISILVLFIFTCPSNSQNLADYFYSLEKYEVLIWEQAGRKKLINDYLQSNSISERAPYDFYLTDYDPQNAYLAFESEKTSGQSFCYWKLPNGEKLLALSSTFCGLSDNLCKQSLTFYKAESRDEQVKSVKRLEKGNILPEIKISDFMDLEKMEADQLNTSEIEKAFDSYGIYFELPRRAVVLTAHSNWIAMLMPERLRPYVKREHLNLRLDKALISFKIEYPKEGQKAVSLQFQKYISTNGFTQNINRVLKMENPNIKDYYLALPESFFGIDCDESAPIKNLIEARKKGIAYQNVKSGYLRDEFHPDERKWSYALFKDRVKNRDIVAYSPINDMADYPCGRPDFQGFYELNTWGLWENVTKEVIDIEYLEKKLGFQDFLLVLPEYGTTIKIQRYGSLEKSYGNLLWKNGKFVLKQD